jgi:hypothetical protein
MYLGRVYVGRECMWAERTMCCTDQVYMHVHGTRCWPLKYVCM